MYMVHVDNPRLPHMYVERSSKGINNKSGKKSSGTFFHYEMQY